MEGAPSMGVLCRKTEVTGLVFAPFGMEYFFGKHEMGASCNIGITLCVAKSCVRSGQ